MHEINFDALEKHITDILQNISADSKYSNCVFSAPGIYFIIQDGEIAEISGKISSSTEGSCFPNIVSGLTEEEKHCIKEMMFSIGFSSDFFSEMLTDIGYFDSAIALSYFEYIGDDKSAYIYRKLNAQISGRKTVFDSMRSFVYALGRYGLDRNRLYYLWDGQYFDLYKEIYDNGEDRGCCDNLDAMQWLEILKDIDNHIVVAC